VYIITTIIIILWTYISYRCIIYNAVQLPSISTTTTARRRRDVCIYASQCRVRYRVTLCILYRRIWLCHTRIVILVVRPSPVSSVNGFLISAIVVTAVQQIYNNNIIYVVSVIQRLQWDIIYVCDVYLHIALVLYDFATLQRVLGDEQKKNHNNAITIIL